MTLRFLLLGLILSISHTLYGQVPKPKVETQFHIEKCTSGIDYPTKGDESVDVKYGDHVFHVRIYHPIVVEDLYFSTPLFWISKQKYGLVYKSFVTVRSHVGVLSWHSINGYFFAAKHGTLRGFFLEDGFDNWDNGSSGLLFLHDDGKSSAWRWRYVRPASQKKGHYKIVDANNAKKAAPATLLKKIAPILDYAEVQADFWPGP